MKISMGLHASVANCMCVERVFRYSAKARVRVLHPRSASRVRVLRPRSASCAMIRSSRPLRRPLAWSLLYTAAHVYVPLRKLIQVRIALQTLSLHTSSMESMT